MPTKDERKARVQELLAGLPRVEGSALASAEPFPKASAVSVRVAQQLVGALPGQAARVERLAAKLEQLTQVAAAHSDVKAAKRG